MVFIKEVDCNHLALESAEGRLVLSAHETLQYNGAVSAGRGAKESFDNLLLTPKGCGSLSTDPEMSIRQAKLILDAYRTGFKISKIANQKGLRSYCGHVYLAELNWEGEDFHGIGEHADDAELAVAIAVIEATERVVMKYNDLASSNGVAAHFQSNFARQYAINEAVERTVFLMLWHSGHLGGSELSRPAESESVLLHRQFAKVQVEEKMLNVVVSGRTTPTGGFCLGFGCHEDLSAAATKAWQECARAATYFEAMNPSPISLGEFFALPKASTMDHVHLAGSPDYARICSRILAPTDLPLPKFEMHVVAQKLLCPAKLSNFGLSFYFAECQPGIAPHWGKPSKTYQNQAIECARHYGQKVSAATLSLPIPFG